MGIENVLPDGRVLTDDELEKAKGEARDWTLMMLERACIPVSGRARGLIEDAIRKIVSVYVKHGVLHDSALRLTYRGIAERDQILAALIDSLCDLVDDYAAASTENKDDEKWVLALMSASFAGMTTRERIERRVERLKKHLLVEIEMDAREHGGVIGTDVDAGGIIGVAGLTDLVRNEVTRAWQEERRHMHKEAHFVHVFRGSSFPCELCDGMVALGWQPVDTAIIPPYHMHCVCWTVYV